ncbi:MAG TPA: DUF4038 domain-containing protein [Methylomirabilota bacterium]|nr:DUF4038 domain-containing protein [Methylomirabilota bacterium]
MTREPSAIPLVALKRFFRLNQALCPAIRAAGEQRLRALWAVAPVILAVLAILTATGILAAAPAYPVKKGPTGRYLVDQKGVPFLIAGESPQAMIGNVSEADAELFFANRRAHGFNTVWINLLCATYTGCRPDGSTFDGILPFSLENNFWSWFTLLPERVEQKLPGFFTEPRPDFSTPNEAYFARVDRILQLAAKYGFLVILDPAETGSWLRVMKHNGIDKCREYGRFLGKRYLNFDNILWMHGNDYGLPHADHDATNDAFVIAIALGIKDFDVRHLHTVEFNTSSSLPPVGSLENERWASLIDLNASYTYRPVYEQILKDYNRPNFLPTFMVESGYEFENIALLGSAPRNLRAQAYWSNLSGATGQMYGNKYTWQFINGWKDHLDTPGSVQMAYVTALFESRSWYELVPDQNHTVVTAGFGAFGSGDYVTAARTSDGKLVMAYVPSARTLTVDMSKLSGPVAARWYDPTRGAFTGMAGSPLANAGFRNFTTPGRNADGDEDWVLVLETSAP